MSDHTSEPGKWAAKNGANNGLNAKIGEIGGKWARKAQNWRKMGLGFEHHTIFHNLGEGLCSHFSHHPRIC